MKIIAAIALAGIFLGIGCKSHTTENDTYFEGKITYKISVIPITQDADTTFLQSVFPSQATMYFKEGNFYETFEGGIIREEFYNREENKDYTIQNSNDTLFWINCGKEYIPIENLEINKNKKQILSIECDELVLKYKFKTVKYYFNSDTLKINPEWYEKFIFQSKNIQMQKMKSLYLGFEMEYPDFTIIWTTVRIEPQKVDEKLFQIPNGKILVENK